MPKIKKEQNLQKKKIIQLFPEYKERIIEVFANIENSNVKSGEITREFDISAEKKIIENNNESTYQIIFFKDNMPMFLLNYVSPSLSVEVKTVTQRHIVAQITCYHLMIIALARINILVLLTSASQ